MYLTAQRVESATEIGINAFFYEHGGAVQTPPPDPSVRGACGKLVGDLLLVTPLGGNKVLSYLDIVCDDGTPWCEIDEMLTGFIVTRMSGRSAFPWSWVNDSFRFELTMVARVAAGRAWIKEAAMLRRACQMVYPEALRRTA